MPNTFDGEVEQPGVRDHGVVALVIGNHHQVCGRMLGGHVTEIKRKVKVQRVAAVPRPGNQSYPAIAHGPLIRLLFLM